MRNFACMGLESVLIIFRIFFLSINLGGCISFQFYQASPNCDHSFPCDDGCLDNKYKLEPNIQRFNDCSESAELESNVTSCYCNDDKKCYLWNTKCLHTCKAHSAKDIELCAVCIDNFTATTTWVETHDWKVYCYNSCRGMCPERECDLTLEELEAKGCHSCVPGYVGDLCEQHCSPRCASGCHGESGYCLDCPPGRYGPECDLACSERCLGGNCSAAWGTCHACATGYTGEDCSLPCLPGFYGDNCTTPCSDNCVTGVCEPVRGYCQDGCKPGYFGARCDLKCPPGAFGHQCLSDCPITCARDDEFPCHHVTGKCIMGCQSGFRGETCNMTCPESKHGADCRENCSETCFRRLCNAFSGICLTCVEPFYGSHCQFNIKIHRIKEGVLGSEVTHEEAIMLIICIVVTGVVMWICVTFLFSYQRKLILKDAANGIDPLTSQWGFLSNRSKDTLPKHTYTNQLSMFGGGDGVDLPPVIEQPYGQEEQSPYSKRKRRRRIPKISVKLDNMDRFPWLWKRNFGGKKLELPGEEEVDRVKKWISRYHANTNFEGAGTATAHVEDEVRGQVNEGEEQHVVEDSKVESSAKSPSMQKTQLKESDTILRSQDQTAQEATSIALETLITEHKGTHIAASNNEPEEGVTQQMLNLVNQEDKEISPSEVALGDVRIRHDAIYLSPQQNPGFPDTKSRPNLRRDTSKVQWLRDKALFSEGVFRNYSTSGGEETTTVGTSEEATSRRGTTMSNTTSTFSSGITGTATNTDPTTRTFHSNAGSSTSSADTSTGSYSSDETSSSEETTTSTVMRSRWDASSASAHLSTSSGSEDSTTSKSKKKDADTGTETATSVPSSILQKLVSAFRRAPRHPQKQEEEESSPRHKPQQQPFSVPGAGGLPRPYSSKFLINRLETWQRNRGLEVNINDGMLEVAGGMVQEMDKAHPKDKTNERGYDEGSWSSSSSDEGTTRQSRSRHPSSSSGEEGNYV